MSRRALAGRYAPAQQDGKKRSKRSASQTPLDFALALMRDEGKPDALRAGMAKAALPYLHKRGEVPEDDDAPAEEPWSDLELARRISHILELGRMEEEKQAKDKAEAAGQAAALPAGPPDWRNSRAIAHSVANAPATVTSAAPARECARDTTPPQRAAWPDDDAAQSRDIYPDPHPGYRWIP
jgi:hypothetical protein